MEYDKIEEEISNITNDNLNLLASIFPTVVKDGQVDFDALKQELGQFEEVEKERYDFTWSGKQNAKKLVQQNIYGKTLNYYEDESKNADTTENLYIEGDNLEVLKLLRENYYNSIKMIYIDPPYNTGKDFIYKDKFNMDRIQSDIAEGIRDEDGVLLQKNEKSSNKYHANWLNIMYPRLKLARDLLSDDGVIFISIDNYEVHNLRKICDEIFGESNFVTKLIWTNKEGGGSSDSIYFKVKYEYILCIAKNIAKLKINTIIQTEDEKYSNSDKFEKERGKYKLIKLNSFSIKYSKSLDYSIEYNGDTLIASEKDEYGNYTKGCWRWSEKKLKWGIENDFIVFKLGQDKKMKVYTKQYFKVNNENIQEIRVLPASAIIDKYSTTMSTKELKKIMKYKIFDYPKPYKLIRFLINRVCNKDDTILDFFSGSGTTAHAVMDLNAEDGGENRKYICVQIPEITDEKSEAYKAGYKNICEIGKERIRRAGEKILEDNKNSKEPKDLSKLDIGFKVFKVEDSNIKWTNVQNLYQLDLSTLKDNPDQIDFNLNTKDINVVYEIMLRQKNTLLSENIELLENIGKRTYLYADSYLICLENQITENMINELSQIEPLPIKFVFRDSAFGNNINLKDNTFRYLKSLINKNTSTENSYTIEFI